MNLVQRMNAAPRCSAMSKRSRRQCRAPAVRGWRVCRFHGARGGAPRGKANGAWKQASTATKRGPPAPVCSPAAAGSRDGWEAVEVFQKAQRGGALPADATLQRIGGVVRHRVDSQDKQDWHRRSRCRTAALPGLSQVATSACLHVKIRRWRALQSACVTGTPLEIKNARDRTRHVDHHQNEQRQE